VRLCALPLFGVVDSVLVLLAGILNIVRIPEIHYGQHAKLLNVMR
jgi:hypothetical protein